MDHRLFNRSEPSPYRATNGIMRPYVSALFLVLATAFALRLSAAPLEWSSPAPHYREAPLMISGSTKAGFERLSVETTGIGFTNVLAEQTHLTNQIYLNGSGVAAGDVDGDGRCDLYFCSLDGANELYRNQGKWRFQEITEEAGVACASMAATGAMLVDLDGDDDLDLTVSSIGDGTKLFRNDGTGAFETWSEESPLNKGNAGMTTTAGDFDLDGDLDLYITNYRTSALMDMGPTHFQVKRVDGKRVITHVNGRPVTQSHLTNRFVLRPEEGVTELGEVDRLYRNERDNDWSRVSFTDGTFEKASGKPLNKPPRDWGLAAMFRDINHDGAPDIYVCNDFERPDRVWINQGQGTFRAIAPLRLRKTSWYSMGVDFADIDRDGHDDFFVLDMLSRSHAIRMTQAPVSSPSPSRPGMIRNRPQFSLNTLFRNRGDGTFAEIAQMAGVHASEWSWTPIFLDVDLDGWEDLLITNGTERDGRNMDVSKRLKQIRRENNLSKQEILQSREIVPPYKSANVAFRNQRDWTFKEVGQEWGFDRFGISHGMALADLDNDGDQDVVVNNLNDAAGIYRNESSKPRIAVRLEGVPPNTDGVGARIKVTGGPAPQSQEIIGGGRYLSSDQPQRTFAAGTEANRLQIRVHWPTGETSVVSNARPNRIYEIGEPSAEEKEAARAANNNEATSDNRPRRRSAHQSSSPNRLASSNESRLFQDLSAKIESEHHENRFDDFAAQPLLPRKLSRLGPGVSWFDVNGDGWADLILPSGRGGRLEVHLNQSGQGFERSRQSPLNQPVTRDQTTVLGTSTLKGRTLLLAGSSNYEDRLSAGSAVRSYRLGRSRIVDNLPGSQASTGPLSLGDVDRDGDLDLFVGGRVIPRKYPKAASSRIFLNNGGDYHLDPKNREVLDEVGLVSGAVWSDWSGDSNPDLALACEWGPVRIFENNEGKLTEVTKKMGLAPYLGWWNGIATGDFNEDGRIDLIASNWGRNTPYEAWRTVKGQQKPLRAYYGDFQSGGGWELIEAHYDGEQQQIVPNRQLSALIRGMPFLRKRYTSNAKYGQASVGHLLRGKFAEMHRLKANWLESTLFLNRGNHFEPKPLPREAQIAPAFGVSAADFNGDGHTDVFLSQNFFATWPGKPRYDAGRGLLLLGDGTGSLTAVNGQRSGIEIYGEQRGAAFSDFNHDGRLDLAVAQNGAATRLFQNSGAKPGLRVKLLGPASNPDAIGAKLRLRYESGKLGPVKELQAGSGYWSQNAAAVVLGLAAKPAKLNIAWPDGTKESVQIPTQARNLRIGQEQGLIDAE